jgi:enoyl-CoA hydratase
MIDLTRHDEFAVLTLSRPAVHNALSFELLRSLDSTLDQVEESDARCLIVRGAGQKAFCAGADISELSNRTLEQELDATLDGQRVISRLETLRQPSIALVNGYALGGGCELALACTFRLATSSARFGLPEVKLGLVPGYGGTQRLSRLIGVPRALEVMMSGRFIETEEALRVGLVNQVLDDGDALEQAMAFGRQFTPWSLLAQRLIRDAVRQGIAMPLSDALGIEAQASCLSYRSEDGREGLRAFAEKRQPRFTDR